MTTLDALRHETDTFIAMMRERIDTPVQKDGKRFQGASNAVASGRLRDSFQAEYTETELEDGKRYTAKVTAEDYWEAANEGSPRFTVVDPSDIREWIRLKNIEVEDVETAAIQIADAIYRRGTIREPNRFFTLAYPEYERRVNALTEFAAEDFTTAVAILIENLKINFEQKPISTP